MGAMRLVFGECEFDSGQRVVCRHGRVIPLSPKALQLLELLLDRRPEAVAKTEILERLWPETFVSDASLHNLVTEVRAALGDSPRATRYIRTVPRYGYAFQAEAKPAPVRDTARLAASGPRLVSRRREWPLSEGSNLIGRDRDCAVRIDSDTLSRRHARIVVTGTESTLEDLESKNGTLVNDQRVEHAVVLKDNDQIQLGSVTVTYRVFETLPSTLTRRGVWPSG
jgi:DNA-binding winged helix-turn-helix (wHTH) protein